MTLDHFPLDHLQCTHSILECQRIRTPAYGPIIHSGKTRPSGRSVHTLAMKLGTSWNLWRSAKVLILLLLVGYFVSRIIDSSRKLQAREIGVSFERIREELVEDSALCYFNSPAQIIHALMIKNFFPCFTPVN